MRYPTLAAGMLLASATAAPLAAHADLPVLHVLTYDSFVADWGPGPRIEAAFEAVCGCDLQFEAAGDGAAMLSRLMLEGARSDVDVVLGLDTNLTARAADSGLFADSGLGEVNYDLPVAWDDPVFVPYDWGYFAFVYDRTKVTDVPRDFEALAASDLKILIEDPRSSTPGLGLLLWVKAAYGDRAKEVWEALADNIVTVTPGWSEAYELFLNGEADMVLSYTTSPAYHLIAENDDTKAAALFGEGHYVQIEVAAKVASTDQDELADRFLAFIPTDPFQSAIPETNWMYPAVTPKGGLPAGFDTLVTPDKALLYPSGEAAKVRDAAIAEWRAALSR